MKQIAFLLVFIICAAGIWFILNNRQGTVVDDGRQPTTDDGRQPTAAEQEILDWLKANGCQIEKLPKAGETILYIISWRIEQSSTTSPNITIEQARHCPNITIEGDVATCYKGWSPHVNTYDDLNEIKQARIKLR